MILEQLTASNVLEALSRELDIPEAMVKAVVAKYEEVGDWLCDQTSLIQPFEPRVYPQGSFRLGTMVKPLGDSGSYDIDLVCRLEIPKESTTQQELKDRVGRRLSMSGEYKSVLEEGRRCWTLQYRHGFHLDILPAIPDALSQSEGILITDRELHRWQFSDPIGYADWFQERMRVVFELERRIVAKAISANVDDVPMWQVKTPLQRAVQLLKRHRDIEFQDDQDDKPISIIITTLAAKSYDNSSDLHEALATIVDGMVSHIEKRDGVYWVPNPVNERENFADKWQEYPVRGEKFFSWLGSVRQDLRQLAKADGMEGAARVLKGGFGESPVNEVFRRYGKEAFEMRNRGALKVSERGTLGVTGTLKVPPHNFYGEEN